MNKGFYFTFLLLLLVCNICNAQNLVPNGSFEQYTSCPNSGSQLYKASPWMNPSTGTPSNSTGTPDFFHGCSTMYVGVPHNSCGDQAARTGNGYSGIHLWAGHPNPDSVREYIEAPLSSPLVAGSCYHFEMYFSQADYYKYTSDDFGVYFSDTAVTGVPNFFPLPFLPQINNPSGNLPDTTIWKLLSGDYISKGGESYLIIGNFVDEANVDSFLVDPSMPVIAAYIYIDDVSLVLTAPCTITGATTSEDSGIEVYPNPLNDRLNISMPNDEPSEVVLYEITSRKVLHQSFTHFVSLNVDHLASGIYLYEVRSGSGSHKTGKLVKE